MKKLFLTAMLVIAAITAQAAGLRQLDMRANLRSDFGLGVGVTFQLPKNFEVAPTLNYYFNDVHTLTIDADFRYRFELPRNFDIYPLAGLVYFHCDDVNKIGLNIGGGFNYNINSSWAIGLELKYQYVDHWDDLYLSIGAAYKF
ncbi:MAG: porin family protein [Bacteroidetes bacterium]|uniref:Porin family protein n=1 Tax=Candidatus Limisoma faecipullorum TaxID=2840854 RepID=A0A9D9IRH3_9BACT|nr:porin family protein [Candidatus Limisoma faecipullorum]